MVIKPLKTVKLTMHRSNIGQQTDMRSDYGHAAEKLERYPANPVEGVCGKYLCFNRPR